jgi:RHS repeat-associated protein
VYDHADRLRESQATNLVTSVSLAPVLYTLDGVHNREKVVMDPPGTGLYRSYYEMYEADPVDRPVNQYTLGPDSRFEYDGNGNLTEQHPLQPGDLNLDGSVDSTDFTVLSGNLGMSKSLWGEGDINGDDVVNAADYTMFAGQWGQPAPPPDILKYDWQNRLIEFEDASEDLTFIYTYDVFGRRLRKVTTETSTEDFVRDERFAYGGEALWQLCLLRESTDAEEEEWDSESTMVHGAVYIDEVVQMVHQPDPQADPLPAASAFYYHHDDLFSVMARTDASGDVVDRYDYSDYGSPTYMDEDGSIDTAPARHETLALFQGREWDAEIAMYQFRYRWMDPAKGRFITRDPIGLLAGMNLINFVNCSPTTQADPLGLRQLRTPSRVKPSPVTIPEYNPGDSPVGFPDSLGPGIPIFTPHAVPAKIIWDTLNDPAFKDAMRQVCEEAAADELERRLAKCATDRTKDEVRCRRAFTRELQQRNCNHPAAVARQRDCLNRAQVDEEKCKIYALVDYGKRIKRCWDRWGWPPQQGLP